MRALSKRGGARSPLAAHERFLPMGWAKPREGGSSDSDAGHLWSVPKQ
jgi:hypothetical protein